MARRFRGSGIYKVDAKGRVSIPAPFRRVIEASDPDWTEGQRPSVVVVHGPEDRKWLEVFSMEAVNEIDQQISRMQRASEHRRRNEDLMFGQVVELQVDDDGRLLLPQKLRDQIGLASEAYFISAGDYFTIWNPETHKAMGGFDPGYDDPRVHLPPLAGP